MYEHKFFFLNMKYCSIYEIMYQFIIHYLRDALTINIIAIIFIKNIIRLIYVYVMFYLSHKNVQRRISINFE